MPDNKEPLSTRFFFKLIFAFTAILFLASLVALPLALMSVIGDIRSPPSERVYNFTPPEAVPNSDYTRIHLHVISIDEARGKAKISVHGYHSCKNECGDYEERILFFEADKKSDILDEAMPTFEAVAMPAKSMETTAEISLPVRGNIFYYPFDSYRLGIGVVIERKYTKDGSIKILTPEETKGRLLMTVEEEIPRIDLVKFRSVDHNIVKSKKMDFDYAYATELKFERPSYFILVVLLVVILSLAVTVFTMTSRPFNQLIINTSALIFGVWSIRSLLLTGYPVDITLLDTILQTMVVFILLALAFRGMNHFHRSAHLRLLPWAKVPKHRSCPECHAEDVSALATRCPSCATSLIPMA